MTILLGFAAINTGNNLIYLLVAFLLAIMGISGFYGLRNINNLSFDIQPPQEIFAGWDAYLDIHMVNEKRWLPSMLLWVGINDQFQLVHFVKSGDGTRFKFRLSFPKRGLHKIHTLTVASRYPFNFFIRKTTFVLDDKVLIFPEPKRYVHYASSYLDSIQAGEDNGLSLFAREELNGLRQYVAGDRIRDIHWKHYARSMILKTKEYGGESVNPVVIEPERMEVHMEDALSYATDLVINMIKRGIPVGLKLKDQFIEPGLGSKHRYQILKQLAEYD